MHGPGTVEGLVLCTPEGKLNCVSLLLMMLKAQGPLKHAGRQPLNGLVVYIVFPPNKGGPA